MVIDALPDVPFVCFRVTSGGVAGHQNMAVRVTGNQSLISERRPKKRLPMPKWATGTQIVHCRH